MINRGDATSTTQQSEEIRAILGTKNYYKGDEYNAKIWLLFGHSTGCKDIKKTSWTVADVDQ